MQLTRNCKMNKSELEFCISNALQQCKMNKTMGYAY